MPRSSPKKARAVSQSLGSWIFGGLLLAFLVAVFVFAPDPLPEYKHRILALFAALLAGLFGWFLSGEIGLNIEGLESRFGNLAVRASGGTGLFVLVLAWWLSPLAPVSLEKLDQREATILVDSGEQRNKQAGAV
ncbi:hypothetical protein ABC977_11360 [Thioalkalicoccus limnaeus]|uniref:DNA translocase FtsK 4TM region domain-containing protein n=1 Tax=Thioalkalicoccus limnaeus TaxID=120681 RepID=A0ABV4BI86_9GAMM